jgi:hypothetical protein
LVCLAVREPDVAVVDGDEWSDWEQAEWCGVGVDCSLDVERVSE